MSNKCKSKSNPHSASAANTQIQPKFQCRRTLAQHIEDNMLCVGKQSYHQRTMFVTSHTNESITEKLKSLLNNLLNSINEHAESDKITGLVVIYKLYSVYMLEGSEYCIGTFMNKLATISNSIYLKTKIVLTYNNINQRFFDKVLFKTADPLILIQKNVTHDIDSIIYHTQLVIMKMTKLCKNVTAHDEEAEEEKLIDSMFTKHLPEVVLIEYILNIKQLLSIEQFGEMFETVPVHYHYDEHVWPISCDFTPTTVYDWGRYDINLIFGQPKFTI